MLQYLVCIPTKLRYMTTYIERLLCYPMTADAIDSLLLMYQLFYCHWLYFPKCATDSYNFIQTVGFNKTNGTVPIKFAVLLSEIL
jgi:hypothetical protein